MLCWFSARSEANQWLARYGDSAIEHLGSEIRSAMRRRDERTARRLDRILVRVEDVVDRREWEKA